MGIHLAINVLLLNQNEYLSRLQRRLTILEHFVTLLLQTINDPVNIGIAGGADSQSPIGGFVYPLPIW